MLSDGQRHRLRDALGQLDAGAGLTLRAAERLAAEAGLPLRGVEALALDEGIVPRRYARNVGALGVAGQRRLLDAAAAVVGLGGLGGHVVEALARLGVGRITGIDPDAFCESNLNRQILSTVGDLGAPKAERARLRAASVNPAVEFVARAERFEDAGADLLKRADAVFDCLDRIPSRRALAARCAAAGVVLVHGAIAGWSGQVGVCPPGGDLYGKLYSATDDGLERWLGCLPVTAAVAANVMVAKALPVLLGGSPSPEQTVQFFDLSTGEWETVRT